MSLTTKEFCIWLKGALDASGTAPNDEMLARMLKMVSIDTGMYGARARQGVDWMARNNPRKDMAILWSYARNDASLLE